LKFVGLTLRVDFHESIQERRDAIDQRWYVFLEACGLCPILLPNTVLNIDILERLNLSGIILTGGNSLKSMGGDSPEREIFETKLIQFALERKLPLLGVCRGMQMLQEYFGVRLGAVQNHVKTRHSIHYLENERNVNSYHDFGSYSSVAELKILAQSADGVIEAILHESLPIKGIMWHPERESQINSLDIAMFKQHFNS